MKTNFLNYLKYTAFAVLVVVLAGCSRSSSSDAPPAANVVTVSADITTNTTWAAANRYKLNGTIAVRNGAVLTIEAGTVIFGDKATKGVLVVMPGARLNAIGTSTSPIVFTSSQPAGQRNYGDWGGIILVGAANVNGAPRTVEGGLTVNGNPITYGAVGSSGITALSDDDNSGTLRYVRIEFGGIAVSPNNETNGLTMAGVGRGTTVEYVQCSFTGDDGFEWFGGAVNGRYLVSYRTLDDDFDADFGWSGNVQFGYVLRDPLTNDQSGSNGFECDNDASGTTNTPRTRGAFSNITVIGPGRPDGQNIDISYNYGAHIRRSTEINIFNSVIVGYRWGVTMEGTNVHTSYNNDTGVPVTPTANFANNIIVVPQTSASTAAGSFPRAAASPFPFGGSSASVGNFATQASLETFLASSNGGSNTILTTSSSTPGNAGALDGIIGLSAAHFDHLATSGPALLPNAGSTLLTGAAYTNTRLTSGSNPANFFSTTATHRGAFGSTNWTTGWTNWNPQLTAY